MKFYRPRFLFEILFVLSFFIIIIKLQVIEVSRMCEKTVAPLLENLGVPRFIDFIFMSLFNL